MRAQHLADFAPRSRATCAAARCGRASSRLQRGAHGLRHLRPALLAQGWTDAIRRLHPDAQVYTFWDYFRQRWQRNAGLRIDHLQLNRAVAPALRAAGVHTWVRGEEKASDDVPAWVDLDLAPARASRR